MIPTNLKLTSLLFLLLLATSVLAQTQDSTASTNEELISQLEAAEPKIPEEKEAMEVGGLVTVDLAADPESMDDATLSVGSVALSANVNVADNVLASITLLAEENLSALSIDQAVVAWDLVKFPASLLFGQQTFNHGLLSTHLISDPLMIDAVETAGPGVVVNFVAKRFAPGLGVTYLHEDAVIEEKLTFNLADSSIDKAEVVVVDEVRTFGIVANLDYSWGEESAARLSARYAQEALDMGLGAGVGLGPFVCDFEIHMIVAGGQEDYRSGYYAGLAYEFGDHLEAAVRVDGVAEGTCSNVTRRIGAGVTVNLIHGIFCAAEYGYTQDPHGESAQEVSVQIGLEQTLKLPGFQRKTLTSN